LRDSSNGLRVLVGVGGWAYLPVEGDKLKACSGLYDFVEVNSTFYMYPSLSTVRSWRRRVPQDFEFTVKCHRDVESMSMGLGLWRRILGRLGVCFSSAGFLWLRFWCFRPHLIWN